jgi:hypothetical protein
VALHPVQRSQIGGSSQFAPVTLVVVDRQRQHPRACTSCHRQARRAVEPARQQQHNRLSGQIGQIG